MEVVRPKPLMDFHFSDARPMPQPLMDFDFNDARPMPFLSAPSTPKRFGNFTLTAPSSPSRMSDFYGCFDDYDQDSYWEENPATPKSPIANDFAFDFRSELEENSLSAEELFDGGKIRPLKPPPRLQIEERNPLLSPRSPRSPIAQGKKMIREVFSPRKKKDSDPFHTAAQNTIEQMEKERGRERGPAFTSNSNRKAARSLSPHRVSEYPWEEERRNQELAKQSIPNSNSKAAAAELAKNLPNSSNKSSSRKWRLKDFLLFRSASEGRASDKDSLSKYNIFFRKPEDAKNSSSRSTDSGGSVPGRKKKGKVSAHELHYTKNKAAAQDLKKRTFLPYKQGILGRLAFNPRE